MTADDSRQLEAGEDPNSAVDAVCALVLVATLVVGALYHVWVSGL